MTWNCVLKTDFDGDEVDVLCFRRSGCDRRWRHCFSKPVSIRKPSGDPTSIKSIIKVRFLLLFPGGLVLGSIPPWTDT